MCLMLCFLEIILLEIDRETMWNSTLSAKYYPAKDWTRFRELLGIPTISGIWTFEVIEESVSSLNNCFFQSFAEAWPVKRDPTKRQFFGGIRISYSSKQTEYKKLILSSKWESYKTQIKQLNWWHIHWIESRGDLSCSYGFILLEIRAQRLKKDVKP